MFIYLFLLELSLVAHEPGSQGFWAFCSMVMAMVTALQILHDGNITVGSDVVPVSLAIELGLFFIVIIPILRIYNAKNP